MSYKDKENEKKSRAISSVFGNSRCVQITISEIGEQN
jgi:hypothetical protein